MYSQQQTLSFFLLTEPTNSAEILKECVKKYPFLNHVYAITPNESIQHKFVRFALHILPWSTPQDLPSCGVRFKLIGLILLSIRLDAVQNQSFLQLLSFDIQHRNLREQLSFQ